MVSVETSAIAGYQDGKTFQQAPAHELKGKFQPATFCPQCSGHFIRLDGVLRCGRCGLDPNDPKQMRRVAKDVGIHAQNAELLQKYQAMEAELAALKVENATLKEAAAVTTQTAADASPSQPTPPRKHRRD